MVPRKICLRKKGTRPWGVKHKPSPPLALSDLQSVEIVMPWALGGYYFDESVHRADFPGEEIHHHEAQLGTALPEYTIDEQIHKTSSDSLAIPQMEPDTGHDKTGWSAPETRGVLHHAALYLDYGFSVIPLSGKRPALSSWKEFTTRRPTYHEIERWFPQETTHNIGIITGRISGGLVVIDCDTVEDSKWWLENHPESPLMVHTGRGGLHIYYFLEKECLFGNRAKLFGRAIDLRGENGYVVAPPSISPITGKTYTWHINVENVSLDSLPTFEFEWLETDPTYEEATFPLFADTDSLRKPRDKRTEKWIQNLVARLDTEVSDRSRRDFAVVCGLLRQGVGLEEVGRLVEGKSKFQNNPKYLAQTLMNALRAIRGP